LNIDLRLIVAELLWLPKKLPLRLRRVDAPPRLARLIALLLRLAKEAWLTLPLFLFWLRESLVRALMLLLDLALRIDDFLLDAFALFPLLSHSMNDDFFCELLFELFLELTERLDLVLFPCLSIDRSEP